MKRRVVGFTLIEVIVVAMIIGVLAVLAIPQYFVTIEKFRSSEGASILTSLLAAEKRYFIESETYTGNLNALDVTIPAATLQYFNAPTVSGGDPIASISRNNGSYALSISLSGEISCAGAMCANLGY